MSKQKPVAKKSPPPPIAKATGQAKPASVKPSNRSVWLAMGAVLALTLFTHFPSVNNSFTNWDDDKYVTANPLLPKDKAVDYFTKDKFVAGNFHPLTMVSYAMDYSASKLNPKRYHIDNLVLHLLNTALVFFLIFLLLGSWQGASIVAALFGVHPMHVESVAWISDRKDLLYTFFYLASLIVYIYYARNKKPVAYAGALLLFVLSLLSKAQAVTLPLSMLLIDYFCNRKFTAKTFIEKIPFFALSVVFGIIAIFAQQSVKAIATGVPFGFNSVLYAFYALADYLFKFILPIQLSCFYPYPVIHDGALPVIFYLSPFIIIGLIALVYIKFRHNKSIIFGALFFLLNIAPLLQLLPVGNAITSDRYTYIPYIGLFFIVAQVFMYFNGYNIKDGLLSKNIPGKASLYKNTALAVVVLGILVFAYVSNDRMGIWKDSESLATNVVENYPTASMAYNNLGDVYYKQSKEVEDLNRPELEKSLVNKAIFNFKKCCDLDPTCVTAFCNLGVCYLRIGLYDSSILYFTKTLVLDPHLVEGYIARGIAYYTGRSDYTSAIKDYNDAIKINPANGEAYAMRSQAYLSLKDKKSAYEDALKAKELGFQINDAYWAQFNQ